MDHAVALVQAYLQANGYFTVAEFPVLSRLPAGGFKSATDVDLLAVRLADSGGGVVGAAGSEAPPPDDALAIPDTSVDLLIVEVKEGRAELNRNARDPEILEAVLNRFGLTTEGEGARPLTDLQRTGTAHWPGGVSVRILAFGSVIDPSIVRGFRALSLPHVATYLSERFAEDWDALRHAQFRDGALGLLALLEQLRRTPRGSPDGERGEGGGAEDG